MKKIILVILTTLCFSSFAVASDWERVSPFRDVRVQHEQIFVDFEGVLYQLQDIDGHSAASLITIAKEKFGSRWEKRVTEDLPEVLAAAGSDPSGQISLVLRELGSEDTKSISRAKFTEENRKEVMRRKSN